MYYKFPSDIFIGTLLFCIKFTKYISLWYGMISALILNTPTRIRMLQRGFMSFSRAMGYSDGKNAIVEIREGWTLPTIDYHVTGFSKENIYIWLLYVTVIYWIQRFAVLTH